MLSSGFFEQETFAGWVRGVSGSFAVTSHCVIIIRVI